MEDEQLEHVEESHDDGDLAQEIIEGMDIVFKAVPVSSLSRPEQLLWVIEILLEDQLVFPVDGFVVGEPISVLAIYYSGNIRQGLMASCRKENGEHYKIAAADIVFHSDTRESTAMAVYRY